MPILFFVLTCLDASLPLYYNFKNNMVMVIYLKNISIWQYLFKYIETLVVLVFLYLFIYNPPFAFFPLTPLKVFYIFLLPCFFLNKRIMRLFFSFFSVEFLLLVVIVSYSVGIEFLNGVSENVFWSANLFMLLENFFFAFVFAYYLDKKYGKNADVLFLIITIIAAAITLYLILNPNLNLNVKQTILVLDDVALNFQFRCFGIASSLTFAYAIVQGIAIALCLERIKSALVCSILFVLLCISIMFNARIGFVPIIFILFYLIFVEKRGGKVLKILLIFSIFILFFMSTESSLDYEQTIKWATSFFQEISDTILGNDSDMGTTNMDVLFNDMIVLPDTFTEWIFGTGRSIYSSSIQNSDIGYFIQLNYGGFVYCLFFILLVISLFFKTLKYRIEEKWFSYLFIVTIIICSYKGLFLITNSGFRTLMLLYFIYFLQTKSVRQLQEC